jgi:hypothetical protein
MTITQLPERTTYEPPVVERPLGVRGPTVAPSPVESPRPAERSAIETDRLPVRVLVLRPLLDAVPSRCRAGGLEPVIGVPSRRLPTGLHADRDGA